MRRRDGSVAGRAEKVNSRESLLRISLQAAVPLWILRLREQPIEDVVARAHELADVIASKGDVIQFKSRVKGETSHAFNALAEGLACCAFAPGGVTFLGDHWEEKR